MLDIGRCGQYSANGAPLLDTDLSQTREFECKPEPTAGPKSSAS